MVLPDYLIQDEHGSIRFAGHRIGLAHLLHYYKEGYAPEMMWNEYPTLPLSLIHKVIAYYLDNEAEVDAYLAQCREEMERQRRQPPAGPTLEEMRRRFDKLRKAKGA
jgi:uncharacterized protein (DUF433 family)